MTKILTGYVAVCKARGCKAASIARNFPGGRKPVCRYCARCVVHCMCEGFERATSQDDINAEKESRDA